MSAILKFSLPIVPTAQARARHRTINTKGGLLHMTYKSSKQQENERTLEACLLPYVPENPMTGALTLQFIACLPVPKSVSKKRREEMLWGFEFPKKKPDLDNIAKQLKDAMTRLHFWGDDKQVVELHCKKIWAEYGAWRVCVMQAFPGSSGVWNC